MSTALRTTLSISREGMTWQQQQQQRQPAVQIVAAGGGATKPAPGKQRYSINVAVSAHG
jgi:hypothetical protein